MGIGKFSGLSVQHVTRVITGLRHSDPIRSQEDPVILKVRLDAKTPFMHQRVVLRAHQQQIIERCLTLSGPMLNMVALQEAVMVTTREAAIVVVSRSHGTLDASGNEAGLATNAEWLTLFILGQHYRMTVTAESFY